MTKVNNNPILAKAAKLNNIPDVETYLRNLVRTTDFELAQHARAINEIDTTATAGSLADYVAPYTGSVSRTYLSKASDIISVKDFGAVGDYDNLIDETVAIQAALDAVPFGGLIYFPFGRYGVAPQGSDGQCLTMKRPCTMIGGGLYTAITPLDTVGDTIDTIAFRSDGTTSFQFAAIDGLFLGDPYTGIRYGRYGILIDTLTAGRYVATPTIRRTYIGQGPAKTYSIAHLNDTIANVNGGMYGALIENNQLVGGVLLSGSGDSNNIINNVITDYGEIANPTYADYATIGVNAALISGASMLVIERNNITNRLGPIKIDSGSRFKIQFNNLEAQVGPPNNNTMIDINSGSGTTSTGLIADNHLGAFTGSGVTAMVRIRNGLAHEVRHNTMLSGVIDGSVGVDIGPNCNDIDIHDNTRGTGITEIVNDSGQGTKGYRKLASFAGTFQNWSATGEKVGYIKDGNGKVLISGSFTGGTVGGTIFTLPVAYRPEKIVVRVIFKGTGLGTVTVHPDGTVEATDVSTAAFNSMDISFQASDQGWTSIEL